MIRQDYKKGDFTGRSNACIDEAIQDALQQAGGYTQFKVVESRGSQSGLGNRQYQVTLNVR